MKSTISYETARATGILNARNQVTYTIGIDGRKNSCKATFTLLETLEETLSARCCYLGSWPVFTSEGIITRVEIDGMVAEIVVPDPLLHP